MSRVGVCLSCILNNQQAEKGGLMPKQTIQGTFSFKKVTNGNKKHFAGNATTGVPGALYLTDRQLKDLGIDAGNLDGAQITVDVRKK